MAYSTILAISGLMAIIVITRAVIEPKKDMPNTNNSCRLRHVHIILRMKNCIPLRIVTRACGGACASYTTTSASDPKKLETKCDCCQYVGRRRKYFTVRCFTKQKKLKSIKVTSFVLPRGCRCRPCSAITNRIVPSETQVLKTSPILGGMIDSNTFKRSVATNYTYFIDG